MSKRCHFTGKGPGTGNNVSHANNKTKRRFMPNLQKRRVLIDGKVKKVWVSTKFLRDLDKQGKTDLLSL